MSQFRGNQYWGAFQSVNSIGGDRNTLTHTAFPFEFTVPLTPDAAKFQFKIQAVRPWDEKIESETATLTR